MFSVTFIFSFCIEELTQYNLNLQIFSCGFFMQILFMNFVTFLYFFFDKFAIIIFVKKGHLLKFVKQFAENLMFFLLPIFIKNCLADCFTKIIHK